MNSKIRQVLEIISANYTTGRLISITVALSARSQRPGQYTLRPHDQSDRIESDYGCMFGAQRPLKAISITGTSTKTEYEKEYDIQLVPYFHCIILIVRFFKIVFRRLTSVYCFYVNRSIRTCKIVQARLARLTNDYYYNSSLKH